MKAKEWVKQLELHPHPEGGFYKETYRSSISIAADALPGEFGGARNVATAIYFLIEKNNFSAFHKIKSDETWHFYDGDALEVIEINSAGHLVKTKIGRNPLNGEVLQYTVPAGHWFASWVLSGGEYSLVGCTVYPGFDFKDFEMAERAVLIGEFPEHKDVIAQLTR
jgi:predicted cupin superfamily sugar epimerase